MHPQKLPDDISQRENFQRPHVKHQRLGPKQEFQTPGGKGSQAKVELRHYSSHRRTGVTDIEYSDSISITRIGKPTRLPNGFKPIRHQQISDQESPFFTITGSFQENTRIKGKGQDFFQPEEERVRYNDPEAVGLSEGSTREREIVVNTTDRMSSPTLRNDMPLRMNIVMLYCRVK
ncbi:hypothetical protein O181_022264 [Austropuccinia psidii MF-1]|uniref:Uncharacterized protein n=1 Tax=Austropuccinia psidii MF-1 TaxID=1389203 RepID=A0A9Q3CCA7_9BASI|nr:hypothetical protein [Austropuccinia psidii MF-1]